MEQTEESKNGNIKKRRKVGRPTIFNEEKAAKLYNLIKAGNYIETASAVAGINKDTFYEWVKYGCRLKEGRKKKNKNITPEDMQFIEFSDAVEEALAIAEARDLKRIDDAAENDWRAAAWKLERRNPQRWGVRPQGEMTLNINEKKSFKNEREFSKAVEKMMELFSENEGEENGNEGGE